MYRVQRIRSRINRSNSLNSCFVWFRSRCFDNDVDEIVLSFLTIDYWLYRRRVCTTFAQLFAKTCSVTFRHDAKYGDESESNFAYPWRYAKFGFEFTRASSSCSEDYKSKRSTASEAQLYRRRSWDSAGATGLSKRAWKWGISGRWNSKFNFFRTFFRHSSSKLELERRRHFHRKFFRGRRSGLGFWGLGFRV